MPLLVGLPSGIVTPTNLTALQVTDLGRRIGILATDSREVKARLNLAATAGLLTPAFILARMQAIAALPAPGIAGAPDPRKARIVELYKHAIPLLGHRKTPEQSFKAKLELYNLVEPFLRTTPARTPGLDCMVLVNGVYP